MSGHTIGPWVIDGQDISPAYDERLSICVIEPVDDVDGRWRSGEETAANASLIAAAPDLLEALIEVTATLEWIAHGRCRGVNEGPIMPSAMAVDFSLLAIARAKGESHE